MSGLFREFRSKVKIVITSYSIHYTKLYELGGSYVIEVEVDGVEASAALGGLPGVTRVTPAGSGAVRVDADRDVRGDIARALVAAGGAVKRLSMDRSSLDEVYVRYFEQVDHEAA